MNELYHHGILGMRWGIRRFQNKDGSLTAAGRARKNNGLSKKDSKWVDKKSGKITSQAKKKASKELDQYASQLLRSPGAVTKSGKLSASAINAYNKKMAELMNEQVSDIRSPSNKVVQFVAKRGEVGVFMALADEGYNMEQLKNGIYGSGRVAYKKTVVNKVETSR